MDYHEEGDTLVNIPLFCMENTSQKLPRKVPLVRIWFHYMLQPQKKEGSYSEFLTSEIKASLYQQGRMTHIQFIGLYHSESNMNISFPGTRRKCSNISSEPPELPPKSQSSFVKIPTQKGCLDLIDFRDFIKLVHGFFVLVW